MDQESVLTRLGRSPSSASAVSRRLLRQVAEAIGRLDECIAARSASMRFPVIPDHPHPRLGDDFVVESDLVGGALRCCDQAELFVVSLGDEVDRLISGTMIEHPGAGAVVDAVASVAAEAEVSRFVETIRGALPRGRSVTPPYSPGYCDWPLEAQRSLFALFPSRPAGVTLTAECLMQPPKSVSGVIGIGASEEVSRYGNACRRCGRRDCPYRR